MILVAGGTGLLGRDLVGRLVARGLSVRVLTRDVALGREVLGALADRVELVAGDVREPASLVPAMVGVQTVVAAVQGFGGRAAGGIAAIDRDGNLALVAAASAANVERFVLLSIHDASPTDALALGRAKAQVEAALRRTAMQPTIVRPTAYMQTWAGIVGGPILESGRARVFGRGRNPINFVSATDVAGVVEDAVVNPAGAAVTRTIEVVGPEDLSFDAIVERFGAVLGRAVPIAHVPLPILRLMAVGLRPFKRILADQVAAALVLDTTDRTARITTGQGGTVHRGTTTFADVIRAMVVGSTSRDSTARAAQEAHGPHS